MALAWRTAFVAVGVVVTLGLGLGVGTTTLGVGRFDHPIVVDADKPIHRVVYFECNEEDGRWWLTASPRDQDMGVVREAERVADQFVTRIKFTTRTPRFGGTTFYHRSHLGLRLEFADQTSSSHVVPIPPGRGQTAIRVVARSR